MSTTGWQCYEANRFRLPVVIDRMLGSLRRGHSSLGLYYHVR